MATARKAQPKSSKPAAAKPAHTNPFSAVDAGRQSAETVVNIGSQAVKDLHSSLSSEAQKTQEKIYEYGRESAQNFSRSADAATKAMNELANTCRDNLEAAMECSNVAASAAQEIGSEIAEMINQSLSESMEVGKAAMSCRTLNDVVELNNRLMKSSVESCFEAISKLSDMAFESASAIAEPINERMAASTAQFGKILK